MSKSTVVFSDDNFENEVIKADVPVLVDFWAEWCGPCRMVGPVVEEIAEDYQGKIKVGKLNVDENPKISSLAGIRSIPTLLIFKNGKAVSRIIGAVPKSRIADMIDGVLNGA